jgi:hypothetical protein
MLTSGIAARLTAVMLAGMVSMLAAVSAPPDPLASFAPHGFLDTKKQADLSAGAAVVDVVPAHSGDIAVFGAAKIRVGNDRLAAWMRQIEDLQQGPFVPIAGRFSDPPRLQDLDRLVLDGSDLEDIRDCERGDCGLKLSADEIDRLRRRTMIAGERWQSAVQTEFRSIVLGRAITYLARGNGGMAPYEDHDQPVLPGVAFEAIAARMGGARLAGQDVADYLRRFPDIRRDDIESFLYWSKERFGSGKPIVTITHLSIIPAVRDGQPEMVIASKQVFATHYLSASLSLVSITTSASSEDRYLVYTRRSHVDVLQGFWGGLTRRILESRIKAEGPSVLDVIRRRLESGEPPARGLPAT